MIFFKDKFWEFPQYFPISSKNKQFSKKNSETISKDFIEIFFSNFHSIFTQFSRETFDFVKSIWKLREKKITKIYRSFDGRVEKSNFGKFWLIFGTIFWKINLNFWQLPILQQFSQNSIIHFLKLKKFFRKNLEKKIVTKFRFLNINLT